MSILVCTFKSLEDSVCTQILSTQMPGLRCGTEWVKISCMQGDVHKYPIVAINIQFRGQNHKVEAVIPHFTHPLILAMSWPVF